MSFKRLGCFAYLAISYRTPSHTENQPRRVKCRMQPIFILQSVVAPWCNPLTLQPEQSGGVGSSPGRAPPLERHDKGSRT